MLLNLRKLWQKNPKSGKIPETEKDIMQNLTLYHFDGCPFCARVKDYMGKNNISLSMKDIHKESGAREELMKIGGKAQVPCLVVNGKALYESLDIIEWLRTHYKK